MTGDAGRSAKISVTPSMVRKLREQHALLAALRRIDRGDEAEPELLGDHEAGDLQRRDHQPRGDAEHHADEDLLAEHA